jgi:Rrf2 family protein
MRLTAMTDYALRLLMYLGRQPERLCTIAEVAQVHGLSQAHLMKITYQLGQRGWITTVRGKGGGMTLALPPEQINLGAVVRSVEPDFQLVECMGAPAADGCVLTRSLPADRGRGRCAAGLPGRAGRPHPGRRAATAARAGPRHAGVRVDLPARKRIPAGPAAEDVA